MLLVHPLRELARFLPVLLGIVVAGSAGGREGMRWGLGLLGVAVPVAVGVLRWLTTTYRVHDGVVELRRGLVRRSLRTAQLDRVRTVDLTASLAQRALGLAEVRIGTAAGGSEGDLELDGLPLARARALRASLLDRTTATAEHPGQPEPANDVPVLHLDASWARFAPLTTGGLAATGALLALLSQVLPGSGLRADRLPDLVPSGWGWTALVGTGVVVALVLSAALAVGGYLVAHWDLTLTRTPDQWHLRRGLTTATETSVDVARVAGVDLDEPWGLRLVGAATTSAVVTGLDSEAEGTLLLVPPAPRAVAAGVAARVLGTDAPVTAPLRPHGPAAVRRRWVRALGPVLPVALAAVVLVARDVLAPGWLVPAVALVVAAALLARDRASGLGHALVDDHLVARSGSVLRRREVLATGHVIGWTIRDTWFQRRAGLVVLEATTAGGRQRVRVLDLPEAEALALAAAATPSLLAEVD
jgi:putative membrane protein